MDREFSISFVEDVFIFHGLLLPNGKVAGAAMAHHASASIISAETKMCAKTKRKLLGA